MAVGTAAPSAGNAVSTEGGPTLTFRRRLTDLATEFEQLQAQCSALSADNQRLKLRVTTLSEEKASIEQRVAKCDDLVADNKKMKERIAALLGEAAESRSKAKQVAPARPPPLA